jgi:hypothetical protein
MMLRSGSGMDVATDEPGKAEFRGRSSSALLWPKQSVRLAD